MKISLSVVVPVLNCQGTINSLVGHLLDVLSELTDRFEVVAVDNGSTDATAEILRDLTVFYPQLRLAAHPTRWSREAVLRTGLLHTSGDVVLYRAEQCRASLGSLADLWRAVRTCDVVAARNPVRLGSGALAAGRVEDPDWLMVRRPLFEAWRRQPRAGDWLAYFEAEGYEIRYVDVRLGAGRTTTWSADRTDPREMNIRPSRTHDIPARAGQGASRPNYLSRLKAFALGE